jgi:hypothetical protein
MSDQGTRAGDCAVAGRSERVFRDLAEDAGRCGLVPEVIPSPFIAILPEIAFRPFFVSFCGAFLS